MQTMSRVLKVGLKRTSILLLSSQFFVAGAVVLAVSLLNVSLAEAAKVLMVKNGKVLIDAESSGPMNIGDQYFALVGGKKKAIIRIQSLRPDGKLVGTIERGQAEVGAELQFGRAAGLGQTSVPTANTGGTSDSDILNAAAGGSSSGGSAVGGGKKKSGKASGLAKALQGMRLGAVAGYIMDSQEVTASNTSKTVTENVAMTGTGYSLKAYGDMSIAEGFGAFARFGFETFNVVGTSSKKICTGGVADCKTTVNYLHADLLARYSFLEGSFETFAYLGVSVMYPISKDTNILKSDIATTSTGLLGLGSYIQISPNISIPINVEYAYYLPGEGVKTSSIGLRTGALFLF